MANQNDNEQPFAAAQERFGSNEYIKASKLLRQLLTREPSHAEAHHWLGKSLSRRSRYVQAIPHFQEAIKRGFDGADAHVELGIAYLAQAENEKELASVRQQKFTSALAEFDSAIAAEPTQVAAPGRVEAGLTAGKACMKKAESDKAQYDKALAYFEAAIEADPTRVEARLEAGRACLKKAESDKAQYANALAYFEAAIGADPTRVEARLEAGRACLKKAESDKAQYANALAYFEAALRQAPGSEYVYDTLEWVVAQFTDQDSVLSRLRKIVQQHKHPDAHLRFGRMLWALDRPELALEQLLAAACLLERSTQELVTTDPVWQFLTFLDSNRKTVADPRSILTRAKRRLQKARDPRAHALWACGLSLAGLIHPAMDDWQRALQQAPADMDCHLLLRMVLVPGSDNPPLPVANMPPDQRAELVTKIQAIIDGAGEPLAHLEWGRTLDRLGNHDAAGREFKRSNSPQGYAAWGSQLAAEGSADLAKEKFLHAFDLADKVGDIDALFWLVQPDLSEVLQKAAGPSDLIDRFDDLVGRSTSPNVLSWWAVTLTRLNRPKPALRRFEDALRLGPAANSPIQMSALGESVKGDPALLQELISIVRKSQHPAAYAELVDLLIELKCHREAFDCCTAWTNLEPENAKAFHKLGQTHSKLKQFEHSITAFRRATELDPGLDEAYKSWLDVIGERDLEAGAVKKLVSAFDGWSNGLDAAVDWQEVERLREMHVQAARELLQEVEAYVDLTDTYNDITFQLEQQGMIPEALRLLQRIHQHWPEIVGAFLFYKWGFFLTKVGDHKRAIIKLQRATALNPGWFYPYYQRAICYEGRQQYRLASCACARALSKGTAIYATDPVQAKADAYTQWARVLSNVRAYDEALEKSRLALELKPSDYWSHFQRAYILADMMLHEQALAEYERATQNGTFPHAHHNISDLWEQQGRYRQAKRKLTETRDRYQREIAAKLRERDAYYCLYYSLACSADHDERKAEDLLRAAIMFDSNAPDFHVSLAQLYLNRTKTDARRPASANDGRADNVSAPAIPARLKAIEHYRKAEQLLHHRLGFRRTADMLLFLGELHLLNDEWDKAKTAFEEAVRMDPDSVRGRKGLAETHLKLGDAAAAIRHLRNAVDRAPTDLSALLLYAQACRRGERLDDAEIGYRKVLEITPLHVDALVGLGELYLDMAEKRASHRNSSGVAELYTKAISSLSEASTNFDSADAPLTIASSIASTYYLLGYAQVKLYETSPLRRDKQLVTDALQNFHDCLARDNIHVKAKRAIDGIKEDRRAARTQLERYAGPAIIVMALIVFVLAQFGLLVGRPVHTQDIVLTPASLARAKAAGLSDDLLGKLKQVENIAFETGEKLAAKAKELMGSENFSKLGTSVIEHAERRRGEWRFETIDVGSYALLTFGSLLLMMAGAFLPQLTSLKLAGLQLEKASAERIETKTTLAIEK